jgi:hypothetical protein
VCLARRAQELRLSTTTHGDEGDELRHQLDADKANTMDGGDDDEVIVLPDDALPPFLTPAMVVELRRQLSTPTPTPTGARLMTPTGVPVPCFFISAPSEAAASALPVARILEEVVALREEEAEAVDQLLVRGVAGQLMVPVSTDDVITDSVGRVEELTDDVLTDDVLTDDVRQFDRAPVPTGGARVMKQGRWSSDEHERCLLGIQQHGQRWSKVCIVVGTRDAKQTRTHGATYVRLQANLQAGVMGAGAAPKQGQGTKRAFSDMDMNACVDYEGVAEDVAARDARTAQEDAAGQDGVVRKLKRGHCEHSRRKQECKECGGSAICEHGRIKSRCKECGGSGICEHGRRKQECKECGGSAICEHGHIKRQCKECGGSGICEHGRRKRQCKECGGSGICEHGRIKYTCKECGGSAICEHDRIKYQCKKCHPD